MKAYESKLKIHLSRYPFELPIKEVLNLAEQADFIEGILKERPTEIRCFSFVRGVTSTYQFIRPTPAQEAFNWLTQQDKYWLDQHHKLFEKLFEFARSQPTTIEKQNLFEKIKTLVAKTGGGLLFDYLSYIIEYSDLPALEVELYLLQAKIYEKTPQPNWEGWLNSFLNKDGKEYLHLLKLYVYRSTNPSMAFKALLAIDTYVYNEKQNEHLIKIVQELDSLYYNYLRQTVYNWLKEGSEADYEDYFRLRSLYVSDWFEHLLTRVFARKSMQQIHAKLNQLSKQKIDKQKQHEELRDLDAKAYS